jgi:hypothetical protein
MGVHDPEHDRLLEAFVAGELSRGEAGRWDRHLLECELCWRAIREDRDARQAVETLRVPAPPGLADKVRFTVEVASAARISTPGSDPGRRSRRVLLAAGGAAAVLAIMAGLMLPGRLAAGHRARQARVPAAVAAVARYAGALPARPGIAVPRRRAEPVLVHQADIVLHGGTRIVLTTWRIGTVEAVVATSARFFPMPPGARGIAGRGMAWSARLGTLNLYCVNGWPSELLAAPVPGPVLVWLAAQLPPT